MKSKQGKLQAIGEGVGDRSQRLCFRAVGCGLTHAHTFVLIFTMLGMNPHVLSLLDPLDAVIAMLAP